MTSPLGKHVSRAVDLKAVAVVLQGNSAATLSVSGTAAQTSALNGGVYDLWATTDVYVKIATTADDVTTSTGYLLRAGNTVPFVVGDTDKIGGITSGAAGTLTYHKVN